MGTAVTSKASAANATITVRRIQLLVIFFSFLSRAAAPQIKWKDFYRGGQIYRSVNCACQCFCGLGVEVRDRRCSANRKFTTLFFLWRKFLICDSSSSSTSDRKLATCATFRHKKIQGDADCAPWTKLLLNYARTKAAHFNLKI